MAAWLKTASLVSMLLPAVAFAQDEEKPTDAEGSKDHPAVKRYPGSIISSFAEKEFEEFLFPLSSEKTEKAEGKYHFGEYTFPAKSSCTQILRNYENAFKAAGLKIYSGNGIPEGCSASGNRWVTGAGKGKSGGTVHILQTCEEYTDGSVSGQLHVVESQAMEQKVQITSDFLADEIARSGHVAVYGINFATGKADITPDSAKVLETIAGLLQAKADWKLRIEGHTDNVGKPKANLELSRKRAQAVKDWLVAKHKVDAARLTTEGYGDTKPVEPNKTDAGRAKNRRVELAKI